jgi:hypothetical protein
MQGCNPGNCPGGCCDGFGNCQPGFSPVQCGNFGNLCQNCTLSESQCVNQQCTGIFEGGPCNPQTCPFGCCDFQGFCQNGNSPFACGTRGQFCQPCAKFGAICFNQQCVVGVDAGVCNPKTCPFGCCDVTGVCYMGGSDFACGTGGGICQNCAQFGLTCTNQQCAQSCAQTCPGCCDAQGNCQPGFVDPQCGEQGNACTDCTALMPASTCDIAVSPRGCTSQQMQCPGPYMGCPIDLQQPPTLPQMGACTATDLKNAAAACVGGAHTASCDAYFSFENSANSACGNCLQQFEYDFSEGSGLAACVQPFVDVTCNHNSACVLDCTSSACGGCLDDATTAKCQSQVVTGVCSSYYQADQCVLTALAGKAAVCSPATYGGNYGAWLQGVGGQYCK